jgi:hypothetical protein
MEPIPLLGGKSVYCINESQLREAHHLAHVDPDSAPRIQARLEELQRTLSRNEQAALAFVLIDRLLQTA